MLSPSSTKLVFLAELADGEASEAILMGGTRQTYNVERIGGIQRVRHGCLGASMLRPVEE
jgi:hypothetical protein